MPSFEWESYLSDTSAEIAPENVFDHVYRGKEPLIKPYQFLLYNSSETSVIWCPALVLIVTSNLIKLEIFLTSDRRHNPQKWISLPRDSAKIKYFSDSQIPSLQERIKPNLTFNRVPQLYFKNFKQYAHECIEPGYFFECEFLDSPKKIWLVEVKSNIGGLLILNWYGEGNAENYFTLHYLNRRIHELGFALSRKISLTKPSHLQTTPLPKIDNLPTLSADDLTYGHPKQTQELPNHEFKVGWRLEAVFPDYPYFFQPAYISSVIDDRTFVIRLDEMLDEKENILNKSEKSFIAHSGLGTILPANYSFLRGIRFKQPTGWPTNYKFTWTRYLLNYELDGNEKKINNAMENLLENNTIGEISDKVICPDESFFKHNSNNRRNYIVENVERDPNMKQNHDFNSFIANQQNEFFLGMKLEFIHPLEKRRGSNFPLILSGTVVRVRGRLLWILPDHQDYSTSHRSIPKDPNACSVFLIDSMSTDLFPLGWSRSMNYKNFLPPIFYLNPKRILSYNQMDHPELQKTIRSSDLCESKYSPKIFFNSRCYPGPFLKTNNLMKVSKTFGPGPIKETLHTIISMIVKLSDKPYKVLRLFEADWFSQIAGELTKSIEANPSQTTTTGTIGSHEPIIRNCLDDKIINVFNDNRQQNMDLIIIRCRCPGKKSKVITPVEIPKKLCSLEEYLKQISLLIEACPNLLSIHAPMKGSKGDEERCSCFCSYKVSSKKYEKVTAIRKRIQSNASIAQRNNSTDKKRTPLNLNNNLIFDLVPPPFQVSIYPRQHPTAKSSTSNQESSSSGRRLTRNRSNIKFDLNNNNSNNNNNENVNDKSRETSPITLIRVSPEAKAGRLMNPNESAIKPSPSKIQRTRSPLKKESIVIDLVSDDELSRPTSPAIVPPRNIINLESNPMTWSSQDVVRYFKNTECSNHSNWLRSQSIDGQALLLLNPKLLDEIGLSKKESTLMMRHVYEIRDAFIRQYSLNSKVSLTKCK